MDPKNVIQFPMPLPPDRAGRPNIAGRSAGTGAGPVFRISRGHQFLSRDKIDLCVWEAAGGMPGITRIVIHENAGTTEEEADLALLYGPGSPWARWGISRCNGKIMLWRCRDGAELGKFDTVRDALATLEGVEPQPKIASHTGRFWPHLVSGFTPRAEVDVVDCPLPHISAWGQTPAAP